MQKVMMQEGSFMGGATYSNCMQLMNKFRIAFSLPNVGIILSSLVFLGLNTTAYSLENTLHTWSCTVAC